MNARFDFNGLELVITDDGRLEHFSGPTDAQCNPPHAHGMVGFQVNTTSIVQSIESAGKDDGKRTVCSAFLAPSHARAIASAMLSAAGRARE